MPKKLQTIYELLGANHDEIGKLMNMLSSEEKDLLYKRYGDDFDHPVSSPDWSTQQGKAFYGNLVPKMKNLLVTMRTKIAEEKSVDYSSITIPDLVQCISMGKSNAEICEDFHLSPQRLYELLLNLKTKGFMMNRRYYSDGSIRHKRISSISDWKKLKVYGQDPVLITRPNENDLRFLVISDLHFGNKAERIDLIEKAFNYCVKKGIHIIFCGGDIIDGAFSKGEQNISNLYQQMEYFVEHYPKDPSILTFGVGGDHDFSAVCRASFNLIDICDNYRQDIVISNYNNAGVSIKNDTILLYHTVPGGNRRPAYIPIVLRGHSHKYMVSLDRNTLNVSIPSLSDITQSFPTALEMTVSFKNGFISDTMICQIYFGDKDQVLNESSFSFPVKNSDKIQNVEDYLNSVTEKISLVPEEQENQEDSQPAKMKQLSAVEKFYKRYGQPQE